MKSGRMPSHTQRTTCSAAGAAATFNCSAPTSLPKSVEHPTPSSQVASKNADLNRERKVLSRRLGILGEIFKANNDQGIGGERYFQEMVGTGAAIIGGG